MSAFQVLLIFVRLQTLALFFRCFSPFYKFQRLFYKYFFALTFIMEIFYFALAWRRLKIMKLQKMCVFLPTSNKSAIKLNPRMQLRSMFHKIVNRNKISGSYA